MIREKYSKNNYVTINTKKITDSQHQLPLVPVNIKLRSTLSLLCSSTVPGQLSVKGKLLK